MKMKSSNMNQTTNAFHSKAKIKEQQLDIITQAYPRKRQQNRVNRSMHMSSENRGLNHKGETLTQFCNRMDTGKVTVPNEIINKINNKGRKLEWYNE